MKLSRARLSKSTTEWKKVTPPTGWTWTLPFTIQKRGRKFRPDPSFNIQTRAGITVSKTYYVDQAIGSDTYDGLSFASGHPFATLNKARLQADVDRIYIKPGYYYKNQVGVVPTRNVETIAVGTGIYVSSSWNNVLGSWSAVGSHYEATATGGTYPWAQTVYDYSSLDSYGRPKLLTRVADVATVDSTVNSFYSANIANPVLSIHTFDGRSPDSNIVVHESGCLQITKNSYKSYYEGIDFVGGATLYNSSSVGGTSLYFKNCNFIAVVVGGIDEIIFQSCKVKYGFGDSINYDLRNTKLTYAIEIDCENGDTGTATSDQCSTSHNGCFLVRINGNYHHTTGQVVADVTGSKSWNLGCTASFSATTKVGFLTEDLMWLDSCWSHDNGTYDLQNSAGDTIYTRNFRGDMGANNIGGTLSNY